MDSSIDAHMPCIVTPITETQWKFTYGNTLRNMLCENYTEMTFNENVATATCRECTSVHSTPHMFIHKFTVKHRNNQLTLRDLYAINDDIQGYVGLKERYTFSKERYRITFEMYYVDSCYAYHDIKPLKVDFIKKGIMEDEFGNNDTTSISHVAVCIYEEIMNKFI